MKRKEKSMRFILMAAAMMIIASLGAAPVHADTTQPTIVSVSPVNNEQSATLLEQITVTFSEEMDPSTINTDTFTVAQRTTPRTGETAIRAVEGTIAYSGRMATFTPTEKLNPNQHYGNVFTVTITPGAKDLAGNALARDYVWSFTTGQDVYNTGASTSQTDQSATNQNATGAVAAPPAQATPPQTGTSTDSSAGALASMWTWILGGALLLLLLALIAWAFLSAKSAKTTTRKRTRVVRSSPFGDVHDVMDLEGIGPTYSKKLQAMGISDTKQLWEANASKVASKTGAPIRTVVGWQHMAELASIHDIGPQYAELLERSGVHSIDQLKHYKTDELLELVRKKQGSIDTSIQGNTPGTSLVGNWIEQAHEHSYSVGKGQSA